MDSAVPDAEVLHTGIFCMLLHLTINCSKEKTGEGDVATAAIKTRNVEVPAYCLGHRRQVVLLHTSDCFSLASHRHHHFASNHQKTVDCICDAHHLWLPDCPFGLDPHDNDGNCLT